MAIEGVSRISLGNSEFEGKNNAYVLDADGLALVDTGMPTAAVRRQFESELASRGYSFADVEDVVLTHWHTDHAGLAAAVQDAGGAAIHIHEADAPLLRDAEDAFSAMKTRQFERFETWGIPAEKIAKIPMIDSDVTESVMPTPDSVTTVADGDIVSVGGFELEVVHAPGHSAGSCCFEFETARGREAFAGDAILPVYTPNIGGSDVRVERPLATYLSSLARLREREYTRLWPGHREPIENPTDRIDEIIDHHRERSERIVSFLREQGPTDAWTVSEYLFGDLDGIHIIHGPGEADAHLEYLHEEGILERTTEGYHLHHDSDVLFENPGPNNPMMGRKS